MFLDLLQANVKAYVDSFAGLVPCKLTGEYRMSKYGELVDLVRVTYTADRGAYKRGQSGWHSARYVVPRKCICRRKYTTLVRPHCWTPADE